MKARNSAGVKSKPMRSGARPMKVVDGTPESDRADLKVHEAYMESMHPAKTAPRRSARRKR